MIQLATFSIAARCPRTGMLGVGVSTAVPAIGGLCSFVAPRIGAVATQSWVNPYLGIDGLVLLKSGMPAKAALDRLIAADPGREVRQVGIVDADIEIWIILGIVHLDIGRLLAALVAAGLLACFQDAHQALRQAQYRGVARCRGHCRNRIAAYQHVSLNGEAVSDLMAAP